jgi:hypothetical protein
MEDGGNSREIQVEQLLEPDQVGETDTAEVQKLLAGTDPVDDHNLVGSSPLEAANQVASDEASTTCHDDHLGVGASCVREPRDRLSRRTAFEEFQDLD